jgi:hypothetical protein
MPLPRQRSALGFFQPLGGFGRDGVREPELPRTHACAVATPRNVAALFHAAGVLGIRPSELSPLGEPYRLPAAVCFLAGSTSIPTRREDPGDLRPLSPAHPSTAAPSDPLREPKRPTKGRRELPTAVMSGRRVERASRPARPLRRPTGTFGHHRLVADTPASKPCSPRESVHRPTAPHAEARAPELAPPRAATDRAVAPLGLRPFRAFSATTSGSIDCESHPGRTGRSSEDHAPLRRGARRFDPEV